MLPVKHSIAVVVRKGDRVLAIRRSDNEDELPGIWGLPAGSYRSGETLEGLVARIGTDKLGVHLTPLRKIGEGSQVREAYRLEMELWEAEADRQPTRSEWQWSPIDILQDGCGKGSLCCELALKTA